LSGCEAKTAVVLAGGAGLRLRPLTDSQPKVMVRVLGKPILQWVIEWLKHNGIKHVIIGVAYCKDSVMDFFGNGSKLGVKIDYSVHSVEGETGEGFQLAVNRFVNDQVFVAMNGDEITNLDLKDMVDYHCKHRSVATIAVANPRSPFGVVRMGEDGLISGFDEKPLIPSMLVSMGVYVFGKEVKDYLPEKGRIEETTFPLLAKEKLLGGYIMKETWMTINTIKELKLAEDVLRKKVHDETWLT
jgi:NDP-sugar pyrophosphorylase family protein